MLLVSKVETTNRIAFGNSANKQFKRDSARVAFLARVGFCVEVPCRGLVMACFTP
ncbi:TPA: DUF3265 domain-containing protein [Vibrio vulnificus]|nr:DUF3265 domain-containing protein [Vibrio vulnificus]